MLRTKTTGLLAAVAAMTAVIAPATADAAKATFSVKLEAKRTVAWDQPRLLLGGSCSGQNFTQGRGSEDFELNSRPGGRLVVEGTANKLGTWTFGTAKRGAIVSESPAAQAVITRDRFWLTGRTGGWCGGAETDPVEKGDCGTRIAPYTYRLSTYKTDVEIRESLVSQTNENYGFYKCDLLTPEGVPAGSLPALGKKIPLADLFNRRKPTVTIKEGKDYGPTVQPVGNGVNRTTSARYDWKITLTRIKNLTPRSENG